MALASACPCGRGCLAFAAIESHEVVRDVSCRASSGAGAACGPFGNKQFQFQQVASLVKACQS